MSRRGRPVYRRICGVFGLFRSPCRGKGGVSVELPVEYLATIFRDRHCFVTLTKLVGAPNSALGSRGRLEKYETSRTTYTTLDKEWR
jgi:hypothetical protein